VSNPQLPSLHAIYAVAGDLDLLRASIASIYPDVSGITIVAGCGRDWSGQPRDSIEVCNLAFNRDLDPHEKVNLLLTNETNEARSRNRAMDVARPRQRSIRTRVQSRHDRPLLVPDYFLIVDADEIWEPGGIRALRSYMSGRRARIYRAACSRYFRTWNYRISGHEWATVAVRSDVRFSELRLPPVPRVRRGLNRLTAIPPRVRSRLCGFVDIPEDVAKFHHGSYVGPRSRIAQKLTSFGHADQVDPDWLDEVWEKFTPAMRDLNPAYPPLFPTADRIPLAELPVTITGHNWPVGYLEPDEPPIGGY